MTPATLATEIHSYDLGYDRKSFADVGSYGVHYDGKTFVGVTPNGAHFSGNTIAVLNTFCARAFRYPAYGNFLRNDNTFRFQTPHFSGYSHAASYAQDRALRYSCYIIMIYLDTNSTLHC